MKEDDDLYGDVEHDNAPDAGPGQDTTAGDGLAGFPVEGYPGWRAGAFGSSKGLLGMAKLSDLVARPRDGAPSVRFGPDEGAFRGGGDPRLILAANPKGSTPTLASDGREAYPMPPAYIPDGRGGVQLRPDFAAVHPGAKDYRGMMKELNIPATLVDLAKLFGYSAAGGAAADRLSAAGADPSLARSAEVCSV